MDIAEQIQQKMKENEDLKAKLAERYKELAQRDKELAERDKELAERDKQLQKLRASYAAYKAKNRQIRLSSKKQLEFEAEKAAFLANLEKKKKITKVDRVAAHVLQSKTDAFERSLSELEMRVDAIAALYLAVTTLKIVENENEKI